MRKTIFSVLILVACLLAGCKTRAKCTYNYSSDLSEFKHDLKITIHSARGIDYSEKCEKTARYRIESSRKTLLREKYTLTAKALEPKVRWNKNKLSIRLFEQPNARTPAFTAEYIFDPATGRYKKQTVNIAK
jgi:hypothetical protein